MRRSARSGSHRAALVAGFALTLVTARPAFAQDDAPELLTAVPETPALAFLDATAAKILRPGSVRDFALALLSGTGQGGIARQGFALEATPWLLIPGLAIDGRRYSESRLAFLLANAQLSIGTARADGEDADTDFAAGLRLTLADRGDPLRSAEFRGALGAALQDCAPPQPDPTPSPACADRATVAMYEAWTAERWNAARLAVAAAWGARLESSELDERDYLGWRAWAVGALPLGRKGQVIAQLQREDRTALGEKAAFQTWSLGTRVLGGSPRINGFVEFLAESREVDEIAAEGEGAPPDEDDGSGSWSAGIEARVAEGLWASAGLGGRFAALHEEDEKTFVAIGLRWGISSAARLEALRAVSE